MEKCSRILSAVCFAISASLLAVWPASAQNNGDIEAQIKALEAEVQKIEPLKDQIERLRSQQLEMKKEATSAAQQMPTFEYRPGRGMTITGADKSWSFNTTYRVNIYNYNVLGGKTNWNDNGTERATGTTALELHPRRNRLYTNFCWSDCFYAFEFSIDGESAEREALVRDNEFTVAFSQLSPWLPDFSIGLRRGAGRTHVSRSSDNDGKMEHSIILSDFGWGGDGSHAGMGIWYDDIRLGPGRYEAYLNFTTSQQGTHQEFLPNDRKGIMLYVGGKPFSGMKSKWISGLEVGYGYQGHSLDRPENYPAGDPSALDIRVRSAERRGRLEFFRPAVIAGGTNDTANVGSGWGSVHIPGLKWVVGPYFFRAVYVSTRYANINPGVGSGISGRGFTFDNQFNLWSPKGFFTGSQTTPNSVIFSWGFERADMNCGRSCDASTGTGSFHSQSVINRETALWYWLRPSLGVGMWHHWWTTSNTPYRTQVAGGCKDSTAEALAGKGVSRSCDFHSFNTGLRFRW